MLLRTQSYHAPTDSLLFQSPGEHYADPIGFHLVLFKRRTPAGPVVEGFKLQRFRSLYLALSSVLHHPNQKSPLASVLILAQIGDTAFTITANTSLEVMQQAYEEAFELTAGVTLSLDPDPLLAPLRSTTPGRFASCPVHSSPLRSAHI
jgi:hypothetical protein